MGFTFVKQKKPVAREKSAEIRKATTELEKKNPYASLLAANGLGLGKDLLFVTFYEDYLAYTKAMELVKKVPLIDLDEIASFLVDVSDQRHYRLLSMSRIADHVLFSRKNKEHVR